jgi:hypothetical protein
MILVEGALPVQSLKNCVEYLIESALLNMTGRSLSALAWLATDAQTLWGDII